MFLVRIILFVTFCIVGLQFPALIDNYKTGCSAVVLELEQEYIEIEKLARKFGLTVEKLFSEANKTKNIKAKALVNLMGDRIPRYIKLSKQLEALNENNLLDSIKIVFFQADPILQRNMWKTFHFNIPMSLSAGWIFIIILFSLSLTILSNIIYSTLILYFIRIFKRKSTEPPMRIS